MSGGNTGTIKIALEMDDKGSIKILKTIGSESEKTGKTGKKSFDDMDKGARDFSTGAGMASSALLKIGAGVGVVLGAAAAIKALWGATKEYVDLSGVQETAETKLEAVLRATGQAAGYNLDQLKSMAGGLQKVTTVGDETTLAGMAILATFKEVKGQAFEGATKAALDMSEVMGQDLKSSMVQLGKALNDPIKGVSALSEVGVTFNDSQRETIKVLQESGDIMGAQKVILAELESEFGGAAEAASKTFKGGLTQAGNALGDVKEELGFVITKNQFFIELTHLATQEFESWGLKISENRDYLMQLGKDGVMTVVETLGYALETMRFFENGWLGIKLVGQLAVQGLAIALDELQPVFRTLMLPLDAMYTGLVALDLMDVNPFDSISKGIETFRASSGDVTKDVLKDIQTTNQRYDTVKGKLTEWEHAIEKIPVTQVKADDTVKKSITSVAAVHDAASEKKKKNTVDVAKVETDLYAKSTLTAQERFDLGLKLLKTEYDSHIKTGVSKNVADRWYNDQYQDLVEKRAETSKKTNAKDVQDSQRTAAAIASAMDSMYRDLKLRGNENYEYQKGLLDAQAEKYREMGVSNELVERWFTERHRLLKEQQILDSDNFFAGVRIGLQRNQEEFQTWAQRGLDITQSMTKSMRNSFSDTLFAALKGDIDDISQVWHGFMDSMFHKLTDTVADMAISWGVGAIGGVTGWWDTGAWEVKQDHVAVVHAGEMIVPADVAQLVRNGAQNPREGMGGAQISDLAKVSPSGGHEWSAADKAMLTSFTKGTLGTYAPYAGQGISLFAKGVIDGDALVSGLLNPAAIAQSVLVGGVPTAFNELMGMRTSTWGTMGQTALSFLGGSFFGPVGAMLGGLMGGTAGMALGDLFNARENEVYRDVLEDALGFGAGLKAYAGGGFDYSVFGDKADQYSGYPSGGDYSGGGGGSYGNDNGAGGTGYGGGFSGGSYSRDPKGGYAQGGLVDRLMVPRGEDGWAPLQFTEGVVSKRGMETLENINSGNFNAVDISELIAEIRMFRLELRQKNHPLVMAAEKTAKYTEISVRRQVAV